MSLRSRASTRAHEHKAIAKGEAGCVGDAHVNAPSRLVPEQCDHAPSIAAARRSLAAEFRRNGLTSADLDARLLIGHALGLDHTSLAAQAQRVLTADEVAIIDAFARRRLGHEPVARILGHKELWGLSFTLNPQTFVPRPETETVVSATLAALARQPARMRAPRIADLGTGSGAILLALLSELGEGASGIGTDVSLAALDCARVNGVAQHACARFIACDYAAAIKGPLDVVVSNPPYIPHQEIALLEPEVRAFDPSLALDGGQDGLDGYRAIAADARRVLAPDGILVVELGFGQDAGVTSIFAAAGLVCCGPQPDLSGIPRALVARPSP